MTVNEVRRLRFQPSRLDTCTSNADVAGSPAILSECRVGRLARRASPSGERDRRHRPIREETLRACARSHRDLCFLDHRFPSLCPTPPRHRRALLPELRRNPHSRSLPRTRPQMGRRFFSNSVARTVDSAVLAVASEIVHQEMHYGRIRSLLAVRATSCPLLQAAANCRTRARSQLRFA